MLQRTIEIIISLFVNISRHEDYTNEVGVSLGLWNMITTSTGNIYGSEFGRMQNEISDYILKEMRQSGKMKACDTKKYAADRAKMDAALKNYINREINRMLESEKPKAVYMAKLPRNSGMPMKGTGDTYFLKMWKKGFVTERIQWKCQKNGVQIIEVIGKGIGTECSVCGKKGHIEGERFQCQVCGFEENKKINSAKNALIRGKTGKQLNKHFPQTKNEKAAKEMAEQ